jgi:hypothetical protein
LTGDAGRGCGDASRALLFVKKYKNTMCCAVSGAARPNMRRAPDDWPELKKSGAP